MLKWALGEKLEEDLGSRQGLYWWFCWRKGFARSIDDRR